jgi:NitT/TauT family transport system substrate-binding protein
LEINFCKGGLAMKMKDLNRLLFFILITLSFLGFALNAALAADKTPKPYLEKINYVLATKSIGPENMSHTFLPVYLGYMMEEGLEVEVQRAEGSTLALQLLVAGKLDLVSANAMSVMKGVQKDFPIKSIYNRTRQHDSALVVPANSKITDLKQLNGKKLGVSSMATGQMAFARGILKYNGLEPEKDVSIIAVGVGARAAKALFDDDIQALVLWDSQYALMENLGYKFRYFRAPFQKDIFGMCIATTDKNIETRRKTLVGFSRGVAKGTLFAKTNPDAVVEIYQKIFPQLRPAGISDEEYRKRCLHSLNTWLRTSAGIENWELKKWGANTVDQWTRFQDFFLSQNIIEKKLPVSNYFLNDPKFIEEVNDFDSTKIIKQAKNY